MTNEATTDEVYAGDVDWHDTALALQAEVTRLTIELAEHVRLAEDANENREGFVSTLSELMPPEDEWYSNPDGSEESEIMAFVTAATEQHRVIYAARERGDFDSDDTLLFGLVPESGRVLVEFDRTALAAHDVALTERVQGETPNTVPPLADLDVIEAEAVTPLDVGEWLRGLAANTREAIRDAFTAPLTSCGAVSGAGEGCTRHPAHDEDWIDVDVQGNDVVRAAGTPHSWEA
jgi:hypothetical protein